MCAIIDVNVLHQVFGQNRPSAGEKFFAWINSGPGSLVIGGKLSQELNNYTPFRDWLVEAKRAGRVISTKDSEVISETMFLKDNGMCQSNDEHIIALARLSGARLLYANDNKLQDDFKNKNLIDSPRGSVYSTLVKQNFTPSHSSLLRNSICKK